MLSSSGEKEFFPSVNFLEMSVEEFRTWYYPEARKAYEYLSRSRSAASTSLVGVKNREENEVGIGPCQIEKYARCVRELAQIRHEYQAAYKISQI